MDLNSSKLISPIILIDPTYKQRNVAAALSEDTFKNFQKICRKFLKNPSTKAFEYKKIDFDKIRKNAQKKGFESLFLEAKTNRQAGDIAGSKLLKFYRHLNEEIKRFFEVKNKEFDYGDKNSAKYFFAVKSKKEILIAGPITKDKKNVAKFKKKHKKVFMKNGKVYSKDKIDFEIKEFIKKWKLKNRKKMTDMGVVGLDFIA
jgi:tRNA nucleotidyltransferase (CCA-adding enzyme)